MIKGLTVLNLLATMARQLLAMYERLLTSRPLQTKAGTGCVLAFGGDILAQRLERRKAKDESGAIDLRCGRTMKRKQFSCFCLADD